MRVQWWWGLFVAIPAAIMVIVFAGMTLGFQSPSDVEGDRGREIVEAQRDLDGARWRFDERVSKAEDSYRDAMPTAQRWESYAAERGWPVPTTGVVWLGAFGLTVAGVVLAALIGALQGALQRRDARRDLARRRAHELALEREKTTREQMKLVAKAQLPPPSKSAKKDDE